MTSQHIVKSILKRSFRFHERGEIATAHNLSGYAFRFSETISFMGKRERFSPDLQVDLPPGGAVLLRDHNPERLLARTPETLTFETTADGLSFRAKQLDTALWRETRELVKQGVLNGASVGFSAEKERSEDGTIVYEKVKLYEVSLVTWPAYSSSEVSARSKITPCPPPEFWL